MYTFYLYVLVERREALVVLFISVLPFVYIRLHTHKQKHTKKRRKFYVCQDAEYRNLITVECQTNTYTHTSIVHTNTHTRTSYSGRIQITNTNTRGEVHIITNTQSRGRENEKPIEDVLLCMLQTKKSYKQECRKLFR